jgi:hypothetical protein
MRTRGAPSSGRLLRHLVAYGDGPVITPPSQGWSSSSNYRFIIFLSSSSSSSSSSILIYILLTIYLCYFLRLFGRKACPQEAQLLLTIIFYIFYHYQTIFIVYLSFSSIFIHLLLYLRLTIFIVYLCSSSTIFIHLLYLSSSSRIFIEPYLTSSHHHFIRIAGWWHTSTSIYQVLYKYISSLASWLRDTSGRGRGAMGGKPWGNILSIYIYILYYIWPYITLCFAAFIIWL